MRDSFSFSKCFDSYFLVVSAADTFVVFVVVSADILLSIESALFDAAAEAAESFAAASFLLSEPSPHEAITNMPEINRRVINFFI